MSWEQKSNSRLTFSQRFIYLGCPFMPDSFCVKSRWINKFPSSANIHATTHKPHAALACPNWRNAKLPAMPDSRNVVRKTPWQPTSRGANVYLNSWRFSAALFLDAISCFLGSTSAFSSGRGQAMTYCLKKEKTKAVCSLNLAELQKAQVEKDVKDAVVQKARGEQAMKLPVIDHKRVHAEVFLKSALRNCEPPPIHRCDWMGSQKPAFKRCRAGKSFVPGLGQVESFQVLPALVALQ